MISNADNLHSLTASVMNRVYEKETGKLYGYTLLINDIYCILEKDSLLEKVRSLQLHLSNAKVCKDGKVVSLYNSYIPISRMDMDEIKNFGSTTVIQMFCTCGKMTCALVYEKARLTCEKDTNINNTCVKGLPLGYNLAVGKKFRDNLKNNVYSNYRIVNDRILPPHKCEQFAALRQRLLDILKQNGMYKDNIKHRLEVKTLSERTSKITLKNMGDNEVIANIIWALIVDKLNAAFIFITDKFEKYELLITGGFGEEKILSVLENAFD